MVVPTIVMERAGKRKQDPLEGRLHVRDRLQQHESEESEKQKDQQTFCMEMQFYSR